MTSAIIGEVEMIRPSALFSSISGNSSVFKGADVRVRSDKRPIDFLAGLPDPAILPYEHIARAFADVIGGGSREGRSSGDFSALSYSSPYGVDRLRRIVAGQRGVDPESVIITNGAMEGVFLSAAATVDSGSRVLVENPAFPQCVKTFQRLGAHVEAVGLTAEGIDVDEVERLLAEAAREGHQYSAIYTIPDFQNPTGRLASGRVKHRLLELAAQYGVAVIADNPYRELWFEQEPEEYPREFRGTEGSPLFEVGSFSKWLGPGLRVGWVIADPAYVRKIAAYRLGVDGGLSSATQYALARLLDAGVGVDAGLRVDPGQGERQESWAGALLSREREFYADKAAALASALRSGLGDDIEFDDPQGGYFLWARLPEWFHLDDPDAQRALAEQNINPVRGDSFFVGTADTRYARFSFAHSSKEDLVEGVGRLRLAVSDVRKSNRV